MLGRSQKYQSNQRIDISIRNYEENGKKRAELIQSLDLGCAHISCLQYNVSIGMTQFGYMDQNRISLFKCCAES